MDIKQMYMNADEILNEKINIQGYVRSNRFNGNVGFIDITDGTTIKSVQVVYKKEFGANVDEIAKFRTGDYVGFVGVLEESNGKSQAYELKANRGDLYKKADEDYPLQKKQHSLEFLREIAHIRPKTKLFQAVMRIRSEIAFAIHSFFKTNNFVWVASPILTSNDGEGAGESFLVTTEDKEAFFNKQATLSVTGQLQAEAYAQAFKKVYTFGPTFRAEKSHTSRHLAEFWMIEPEIALCDLDNLINLATKMLQSIIKHYFEKCENEINYLEQTVDSNIRERLNHVLNSDFVKLEYTKAIEILEAAIKAKPELFEEKNIYWGMDLASEHEKYLCEKIVKGPVFIYNYPKEIKAFYMKQNADNKTVAATDLLVPGIGEIIGGSQREDDYNKLLNRCNELSMNIEPLQWYLDLRKYGYFMSSGFGLGFERLIMYLTGVENARDVIPFPRTHGNLEF